MKNDKTNVDASIHARLLQLAKERGQPFEHLMKRYAMERFLYRLSKSEYAKDFILKGGLLLASYDFPSSRPTLDIDLQAISHQNESEYVTQVVKNICRVPVPEDGLRFDYTTIVCEALAHLDGYEGVRARVVAYLGRADITVQIDVGFGGVTVPPPEEVIFPTLLGMPPPLVSGYKPETVIAEKLDAMVKHDAANTRMKDFYDVLLLAAMFEFDGKNLSAAIRQTFKLNQRKISDVSLILRRELAEDMVFDSRWKTFLNKNRLSNVPSDFVDVIQHLRDFIIPLLDQMLASASEPKMRWTPPGPWQ